MGRSLRNYLRGLLLLKAVDQKAATEGAAALAPTAGKVPRWLRWAALFFVYLATVVVLPTAAVAGVGLFGFRTVVVETQNLAPEAPQGTVLVQEGVPPNQLRSGDIISFTADRSPGAVLTHRVLAVETRPEGLQLTTRPVGAGSEEEEIWLANPLQPVGRTVFQVPLVGYVLQATQTPALLVGLIALGLLLLWGRSRSAGGST